jgi:uncharacterized RDD family membrane protein YckC
VTAPDAAPSRYPGERLHLPQSGARSIARPGRRILAILIDWAIATGVSFLITRPADFAAIDPGVTLAAFAVLQVIFLATAAGSIGHLIMGLRVVPLRPAWIGILRPVIRTVLLCLAVPALIWDSDQRGLHDKAAGTLLVRR